MRAVDQKTAEDLRERNTRKAKEIAAKKEEPELKKNRNLHLANEGLVVRGSPAAAQVSESDFIKREHAQTQKKQKLRDPNYFVSDTRLAIRNIPKNITQPELKEIFRKVNPKAKFKQVKLLRENSEKRDEKGEEAETTPEEKSKGIGFVEYFTHEDALTALRKINNNPSIFTVDRRPIVEFALENIRTLRKRMLTQEQLRENKLKEQGSGWQNPSKDRLQKNNRTQKPNNNQGRGRPNKPPRDENKKQERPQSKGRDSKFGNDRPKQQKKDVDQKGNKRKFEKQEKAQKPPKKQKVSKEWEKEKKLTALIDEYKSKYFS